MSHVQQTASTKHLNPFNRLSSPEMLTPRPWVVGRAFPVVLCFPAYRVKLLYISDGLSFLFLVSGVAGRSVGTDPLLHANTRFHLHICPRRTRHGMSGSLTLEEVAGSMSRPLSAGTMSGHLAACLEAGLTFEWDRRRLGIDPALEGKVREKNTQDSERGWRCIMFCDDVQKRPMICAYCSPSSA